MEEACDAVQVSVRSATEMLSLSNKSLPTDQIEPPVNIFVAVGERALGWEIYILFGRVLTGLRARWLIDYMGLRTYLLLAFSAPIYAPHPS